MGQELASVFIPALKNLPRFGRWCTYREIWYVKKMRKCHHGGRLAPTQGFGVLNRFFKQGAVVSVLHRLGEQLLRARNLCLNAWNRISKKFEAKGQGSHEGETKRMLFETNKPLSECGRALGVQLQYLQLSLLLS